MSKVEINQYDDRVKVIIDGKELERVTDIQYNASVGVIPEITLKFYSNDIVLNLNGMPELVLTTKDTLEKLNSISKKLEGLIL
jgi:hypothetical protein